MLTISEAGRSGEPSRRTFLRAGGLALGGLGLGDVLRLRAEAPAPGGARPKSAIMIFLGGGPSHLDMYDLKPGAPAEYRGEFRPVKTTVPGLDVCELMPLQARLADKFAVLRGVRFVELHTANEFFSGYPWQESPRASAPGEAQRPAVGSVVSRVRGAASAIPPYVSLTARADWERAYYLGAEHEPFRVGDGGREPLQNMTRHRSVDAARLDDRRSLLRALDTLRRDLDARGGIGGLDAFQDRALQVITSGKVRDAFDVHREPERVRARYGERPVRVINQECNVVRYSEVPHPGRALLQARRLVEAGVAVVTCCAFVHWDTHRYNFTTLRQLLPPLDQAVSALIEDLDARGLLGDVAVVMGGEFGRRPRIGDVTPDGRTHWPEGFLWVAGGGLRTGQVIGATDARGESSVGRPIRMPNVLATLYQVLGIDPAATFPDYNGRPQYVLDDREPVGGLL